eukprot:217615-Pleurochrysis_carterae.AAC.1
MAGDPVTALEFRLGTSIGRLYAARTARARCFLPSWWTCGAKLVVMRACTCKRRARWSGAGAGAEAASARRLCGGQSNAGIERARRLEGRRRVAAAARGRGSARAGR